MQLKCPKCNDELKEKNKTLIECVKCRNSYACVDNIPMIFRNPELQKEISKEWESVADTLVLRNQQESSSGITAFSNRTCHGVSALVSGFSTDRQAEQHLILDVGCGIGGNILLLKKLGYKNFVATEFSINRIKQAKTLLGKDDKTLFVSTDCFPFQDASFDAIISTAVIEHVEDQKYFVKEVARVLKPGGIAVITSDCFIFRFYTLIGSYRSIQPIDIAPNPFNLLKTFKKCGLETLHFNGFSEINYFFPKSIGKAIFRELIGEKRFGKIKEKLKENNPFHAELPTVNDDLSFVKQINYSKSLSNLWRVFFSKENIFVVKKNGK